MASAPGAAQGVARGRADEGPDDQDVGDGQQGGPGDQEQPAVPQGQAQPHGPARPSDSQRHRERVAGVHRCPPMRYPDLGSVSMSGGSPSLARSRLTVIFTAAVNGSAFSSHARSSSSSAETVRPPAASSNSSTPNSFGARSSGRPARQAMRRAVSTTTSPQHRTGG